MGHDWPPRLSSSPGCAVIGKLKPLSVTGSCLPVSQWHLNSLAFESKPVPHGCVWGAASVLKGGKEERIPTLKMMWSSETVKDSHVVQWQHVCTKVTDLLNQSFEMWWSCQGKHLLTEIKSASHLPEGLGIRVIKPPMKIGSGPHQVIKFPVWPWSSFCLFFPPYLVLVLLWGWKHRSC